MEFEVFPKLDELAEPHCIQRAVESKGYMIKGQDRVKECPLSVFKYTISGYGIIEVEGIKYKVPANHGFLANVTSPRINYCYPENGTEPWEFVFIAIKKATRTVEAVNQRFGWVFQMPESSWLVRTLLGYSRNSGSLCLISPGKAHLLAQSVLSELVENSILRRDSLRAAGIFRAVSGIVLKNLDKRLSLADIASRMKISKEHLARTFKSETGMTALEYIQQEQMRHARELLKDRSIRVKEIAFRMGFDTPSHFNRLFKKHTGTTPMEYRNNQSVFI